MLVYLSICNLRSKKLFRIISIYYIEIKLIILVFLNFVYSWFLMLNVMLLEMFRFWRRSKLRVRWWRRISDWMWWWKWIDRTLLLFRRRLRRRGRRRGFWELLNFWIRFRRMNRRGCLIWRGRIKKIFKCRSILRKWWMKIEFFWIRNM